MRKFLLGLLFPSRQESAGPTRAAALPINGGLPGKLCSAACHDDRPDPWGIDAIRTREGD